MLKKNNLPFNDLLKVIAENLITGKKTEREMTYQEYINLKKKTGYRYKAWKK